MQTDAVNTRQIAGFADYTLAEHVQFSGWLRTVKEVYDSYAFTRLESRKVERGTDLSKKGGLEREIYAITHYKGGEVINDSGNEATLCIPFDRTVPFALWVAHNINNLHFPIKRQDVDYSWRVEKPSPGRFRAFVQADVDIVDRELNILAEAECIKAILEALSKIGINEYNMYLNHIAIAKSLIGKLGEIGEEASAKALRVVDKLDKITQEEAISQIMEIAPLVSKEEITSLVEIFSFKGMISDFRAKYEKDPRITKDIIAYLEQVSALSKLLEVEGIDPKVLCFCPGMVRGLDYYTGIVFETYLKKAPHRGSIASGGRYDNLVDAVSETASDKTKIQGFGGSIGLTRLYDVCRRENLINPTVCTAAKVLVCYRKVTENSAVSTLQIKAAELASRVREYKINADLFTNSSATVKKQLGYANEQGHPNVVLVMEPDAFVVKDMIREIDREVKSISEAVDILKQNIQIQEAISNLEKYQIAVNPSGKKTQAPKSSANSK